MDREDLMYLEDISVDFENQGELPQVEEESITFKCKPCWNFQSIEFEVNGTVEHACKLYDKVLKELMKISPIQDNQIIKKGKPLPMHPATPKQKEIMEKFGIQYDIYTSKEEASKLIDKSMGNYKD